MPILDKNLMLEEIQARLNDYIPANTVSRILKDATEIMERYDVVVASENSDNDGNDLIKLYLDAKECEGRSANTIRLYKYALEKLKDNIGVSLRNVTVYHLRSYLMSEKERGVSPSTVATTRSIIASFYTWLHSEGLIERNPTSNLATIKQPKEVRKPFSAVEIEKLRDNVKNLRDSALIEFLLSTGCRISEVCSVNRADIDLRTLKLVVTGKGNKQRTVYLDEVTAMRVQKYLKSRTDFSPALFVGKGTDRMTPGGIRKTLNEIANRAGVENVHPHRFRRTLATNLIDHGMSIQEVASILGHDKLDTTMTYIYVNQRNVESAYRRFA